MAGQRRARTTLHSVNVQFGDCDSAGIVSFPDYSRWFDAASLSFCMQCGLPPWREWAKTRDIVGTPLLEICEGREPRAMVKRDEVDPDRLRAIPVPGDIRLKCS